MINYLQLIPFMLAFITFILALASLLPSLYFSRKYEIACGIFALITAISFGVEASHEGPYYFFMMEAWGIIALLNFLGDLKLSQVSA